MKKSDEILNVLNTKIEACEKATGEEKVTLFNEVKALKEDLRVQKELEQEEIGQVENKITDKKEGIEKMENKKEISLLNAMVKNAVGQRLTQDEAQVIQDATVMNAVTGSEHIEIKELSTKIKELLRNEDYLKNLVTVHKTNAANGQFPVDKTTVAQLVEVVDGTPMVADTDLAFDVVKFEIKKFGKLGQLTNTILKYSTADLVAYLAKYFVKAYVATVNKRIVDACLKTEAGVAVTPVVLTGGAHGLAKVVRTGLDKALQPGAVVLMNDDAFEKLIEDKKQDAISFIQPDITKAPIPVINGCPVKVVDKKTLPNVAADASAIIYANFAEYLMFVENEEYSIEVSKEAGFLNNTVYSKIITYFDLCRVDEEACKVYSISL